MTPVQFTLPAGMEDICGHVETLSRASGRTASQKLINYDATEIYALHARRLSWPVVLCRIFEGLGCRLGYATSEAFPGRLRNGITTEIPNNQI
jgi:hypothetical protein